MTKINNWVLTGCLEYGVHLIGTVEEHPSLSSNNGNAVRTSTLKFIDFEKGIAQTRNTTYQLGTPLKTSKWI